MKIIGLCGGSGSGKGMVCDIFRIYDIPSIDTDKVYHEFTSRPSSCLDALKKEFGDAIIAANGVLDRKALAKIVFCGEGSEERLGKLNMIAHSYILDETRYRLSEFEKKGYEFAIVDAPVLFESGFNAECDIVIGVVCDAEIRIERIVLRDSISRDAAISRINSQMTDAELMSKCDYIIHNNLDIDSLKNEIEKIVNKIKLTQKGEN